MTSSKVSKHHSFIIEAISAALSFAFFLYTLRHVFFFGDRTFAHENISWDYPVFHYFASSLLGGHFPLWNPFSHAGEPFYPLLAQIRLLDPTTLLTIKLGGLLTHNTLLLFSWNRLFQTLFLIFGIRLVLNDIPMRTVTRVALWPLFFFSSCALGSFQQDGVLNSFFWAPYTTWAFFQLVLHKKQTPTAWLVFAISLGLSFQSYFFAAPLLWISVLFLGTWFFHRDKLETALQAINRRYFLITCFILAAMSAPNLALFHTRGRYVFPLRMASQDYETKSANGAPLPYEGNPGDVVHGIHMPYDFIEHTGGHLQTWDLLQALAPEGNAALVGNAVTRFGNPSDTFLFFGPLALALAILGFFTGIQETESLWRFALLTLGLLALGPVGGIHRLLYLVFPPLWCMRNTGALVLYLEMGGFYFFVLGFERLLSFQFAKKSQVSWQTIMTSLLLTAFTVALSLPLFDPPSSVENYLPLFLALLGLGFWCASAYLEAFFQALTVLLSLVILVALFHPQTTAFLIPWFILGVAPFFIFLFSRRVGTLVIGLALTLGVLLPFLRSRHLYDYQKSPASILGVSSVAEAFHFPLTRRLAPRSDRQGFESAPRYLELLYGQSVVFSPSYPFDPSAQEDSFSWRREHRRWNNFLLSRDYFFLIHSQTLSDELERIFALNAPTIQFSPDASGRALLPLAFHVDSESPNSLTLTVTAKSDGYLYWADGYDPDWQASLNGSPVPIQKMNDAFKGIRLPAGISAVRFVYRPLFWCLGLWLFYGAFLCGIAGLVITAVCRAFKEPQKAFDRFALA